MQTLRRHFDRARCLGYLRAIFEEDRKGSLDESQITVPDWINGVHELFPKRTIERLEKDGLVAFRYGHADGPGYPDNPNGSTNDIAGLVDPSRRESLAARRAPSALFPRSPSFGRVAPSPGPAASLREVGAKSVHKRTHPVPEIRPHRLLAPSGLASIRL